jgi:hypothetical protein
MHCILLISNSVEYSVLQALQSEEVSVCHIQVFTYQNFQ